MISTTEFVQIGSLVITGISLLIAIALYFRNKHLEYKNHLYKSKLEAFSCIAYEMESLLNYYNRDIFQLTELKKLNTVLDLDKLKNKGDQADDFVYEFSNKIVKYSVCFPEPIVLLLYDLSHTQYSQGSDINNVDEAIKLIDEFIDLQVNKMNTINNLIRKDLKLSKMNQLLFKRIS